MLTTSQPALFLWANSRRCPMNATKHAVIIALFAIMQKGKTHYSKASVTRIIELLETYHGITVKRRWLFYCLAYMEKKGYVRRQERYQNHEDGQIHQLPSLVTISLQGIKYLVAKRVAGAKKLLDRMMAWVRRKDNRFPNPEPGLETPPTLSWEENQRRVKKLLYEFG